jgi:hypothetical protein
VTHFPWISTLVNSSRFTCVNAGGNLCEDDRQMRGMIRRPDWLTILWGAWTAFLAAMLAYLLFFPQ